MSWGYVRNYSMSNWGFRRPRLCAQRATFAEGRAAALAGKPSLNLTARPHTHYDYTRVGSYSACPLHRWIYLIPLQPSSSLVILSTTLTCAALRRVTSTRMTRASVTASTARTTPPAGAWYPSTSSPCSASPSTIDSLRISYDTVFNLAVLRKVHRSGECDGADLRNLPRYQVRSGGLRNVRGRRCLEDAAYKVAISLET